MKLLRQILACTILGMLLPAAATAADSIGTGINCKAKHTLYRENFKIVAFYQFILSENEGVLMLNGKVTNDEEVSYISRNIYFTYTNKSENHYVLKNYKIDKIPADTVPDEIMKKNYPAFFINEGEFISLNIQKVNEKSHIISYVNTPMFYCSE